ncbi:MAG: hypothetical protein ABIG71_03805 [Candidatus Uhrbacteria bacterium]
MAIQIFGSRVFTATVNQPLLDQLTLRVTDGGGNPLPNREVTYASVPSDAIAFPGEQPFMNERTDDDGYAILTSITPRRPGPHSIVATVDTGEKIAFTINAVYANDIIPVGNGGIVKVPEPVFVQGYPVKGPPPPEKKPLGWPAAALGMASFLGMLICGLVALAILKGCDTASATTMPMQQQPIVVNVPPQNAGIDNAARRDIEDLRDMFSRYAAENQAAINRTGIYGRVYTDERFDRAGEPQVSSFLAWLDRNGYTAARADANRLLAGGQRLTIRRSSTGGAGLNVCAMRDGEGNRFPLCPNR